jgi:hypothetical protein
MYASEELPHTVSELGLVFFVPISSLTFRISSTNISHTQVTDLTRVGFSMFVSSPCYVKPAAVPGGAIFVPAGTLQVANQQQQTTGLYVYKECPQFFDASNTCTRIPGLRITLDTNKPENNVVFTAPSDLGESA